MFLFLSSRRLSFLHPSALRVTKAPRDVLSQVGGVRILGVAIGTYDLAHSRLCVEVSDGVTENVMVVFVRVHDLCPFRSCSLLLL